MASSWTFKSSLSAMSGRAQIRLPTNAAAAKVRVLDLRGSTTAMGCAYRLYVFSAGMNFHREWCATSQPASSYNSEFYLHSNGQVQLVDIVFNQSTAAANGAVWIQFEGTPLATHTRHLVIIYWRPADSRP